MEGPTVAVDQFVSRQHIVLLVLFAVAALSLLTRSADAVMSNTVEVAQRLSIPPVLIGATVASLGTTLPKVAVLVVASLHGDSALAFGNATGSIAANVGLIGGVLLLTARRRIAGSSVTRSALSAVAGDVPAQGSLLPRLLKTGLALAGVIMTSRTLIPVLGELGIGNVLGANLMNVLVVIGLSATARPQSAHVSSAPRFS